MSGSAVLPKLILQLLAAIHGVSSYPVPERVPEVRLVPHERLERMACERPCEVYGWFPGGATIYLDDRLDPASDIASAGILVHELVHFVQQENGRFVDRRSCDDWVKREREAYRIQTRWLRAQPGFSGPFPGSLLPPWRIVCEDHATGG